MHMHALTYTHKPANTRGGKTAARNGKSGSRVYCSGKIKVLRLDLKESGEGFRRTGRGSFHVEGPKTEKSQEPTVKGLG